MPLPRGVSSLGHGNRIICREEVNVSKSLTRLVNQNMVNRPENLWLTPEKSNDVQVSPENEAEPGVLRLINVECG